MASSCHNDWTGCNIMILKNLPLSPAPLPSRLSKACPGSDKLGIPTWHSWKTQSSAPFPRDKKSECVRRESRLRARYTISSRRARNSKKKRPDVRLCACFSTGIVHSFARRRASRAEEIGFARGCWRVHFCMCNWSRVCFLGGLSMEINKYFRTFVWYEYVYMYTYSYSTTLVLKYEYVRILSRVTLHSTCTCTSCTTYT